MPERIKPRLERDLSTRPNIRGRKSIHTPTRINPFDFHQTLLECQTPRCGHLTTSFIFVFLLGFFFQSALNLDDNHEPDPPVRERTPRQLAYRRRRRPRTNQSIEPGFRPAAWLSQHQHRSLKGTRITPNMKFDGQPPKGLIIVCASKGDLFTAEWDGGQATPLEWRSPLTPDPVTGWVGHPLQAHNAIRRRASLQGSICCKGRWTHFLTLQVTG